MPGWTLVDTHPTHGRTFQRPLDALEMCYLWDGRFNGTADAVYYYELSLSEKAQKAGLASEANVIEAWVSTKRRFPLAGATVCGADGEPLRLVVPRDVDVGTGTGFVSEPHFVVREQDLSFIRPHEVVFGSVASTEEAQQQAAAIVHGPRPLSDELLIQLRIFCETDTTRMHVVHVIMLVAHCMTDGSANRTLMRCFLDTFARGRGTEFAQRPLEERLAMVTPPMDHAPEYLCLLSPAIQRWRKAIGMVIYQLRAARRQGGHTLPCRLTRSTWHVIARPGLVSTSLTQAQTAAVIANCRLHDLTFGIAYLPLAQVAMTRVLYRRYLCGEISEEEWAYRMRQPHISGGPFNLRRYLDNAWFENGGGGEFMLSISLFIYQLPFMTLGAGATAKGCQGVWSDGAPPFSELLTFDRFLHRAGLVKKQAMAFFNHPLFLEIVHAGHMAYGQHTRIRALRRMQHAETVNAGDMPGDPDEDEVLAVTDIPTIWAHGGSSLGNLDLISPTEYPLPPTHPLSPYASVPHPARAGYVTPSPPPVPDVDTTPTIVVENARVHLHTRPAELYLGAATSGGRMNLYVQYDANVFEEGVVEEWLNEVREAVVWYLGGTQ